MVYYFASSGVCGAWSVSLYVRSAPIRCPTPFAYINIYIYCIYCICAKFILTNIPYFILGILFVSLVWSHLGSVSRLSVRVCLHVGFRMVSMPIRFSVFSCLMSPTMSDLSHSHQFLAFHAFWVTGVSRIWAHIFGLSNLCIPNFSCILYSFL